MKIPYVDSIKKLKIAPLTPITKMGMQSNKLNAL